MAEIFRGYGGLSGYKEHHMKLSKKILTIIAATSVSTAFGQGLLKGTEPVAWPKMGHEFRSGLTYDNRGFAKVDPADKPKSLATMAVERAKIKFTGDLSPDISFFVRLAFEPTAKQALDYAMLTLRLDEHWSIGSGKTWNYISGYEWPNSLAEYVGTSAFPFTMGATTVLSGYSKQTFELAHKGNINWRVQLFDDVKVVSDDEGNRTSGGYFSSRTQPAASLQLQLGSLAETAWKPLLQLATYDAGHSRIVSLGGQYKEGPWLTYIQTAVDLQAQINNGEKTIHQRNYANGLIEYSYAEWTPFLRWQWFDIKQGGTNLKGNSASVKDVSDIDDNIESLSVGGRYMRYGERFMPYFAVAASKGEFQDSDESLTKTRTRTLTQLKLGVISKL